MMYYTVKLCDTCSYKPEDLGSGYFSEAPYYCCLDCPSRLKSEPKEDPDMEPVRLARMEKRIKLINECAAAGGVRRWAASNGFTARGVRLAIIGKRNVGPKIAKRLAEIAVVVAVVLITSWGAHAHDWRKPNLDQWYGSLKRPNVKPGAMTFTGCCSREDCHETEAEQRNGDWWARIGVRKENGDWDLVDFVKVPVDVILQNQSNPTGSAVICHSSYNAMGGRVDPQKATIWCFIRPTES